jgi:hypothetical protein
MKECLEMSAIINNTFFYSKRQRDRFKKRELLKEWYEQYPQIFDEDDFRITEKQPNRHFFEWLSAVLIFQSTGYLSLVEKYQFKIQKRKYGILKEFAASGQITAEVYDLIINRKQYGFGNIQCPDLFVYLPDGSDWYFCEAKGAEVTTLSQKKYFEKLSKVSGKKIQLMKFRELD